MYSNVLSLPRNSSVPHSVYSIFDNTFPIYSSQTVAAITCSTDSIIFPVSFYSNLPAPNTPISMPLNPYTPVASSLVPRTRIHHLSHPIHLSYKDRVEDFDRISLLYYPVLYCIVLYCTEYPYISANSFCNSISYVR